MSVSFGTSGLRGPAVDFTGSTSSAYVRAFLEVICAGASSRTVYLGADLRASSPEIAGYAAAAISAAGWTPVYAGNVPTPALAAYALARQSPAVMVTGSHIPEDYNGIKFYRPDGEFLKEDEAPVRERAEALLAEHLSAGGGSLPPVDPAIAEAYVARYIDAFSGKPLKGLRIGLDLHSAVGRDLTARIVEGLGAEVFPFRRSDHFIAVDTEALDPADLARAKEQIATHRLDAVVSTDGDGDRPLVIDEAGRQVNGDVLGILTARRLGAKTVVTPISSTSAIEMDIGLLFEHFAHQAAARYGRPVPRVDSEKLQALMAYQWPGNVRELKNAADRWVLGDIEGFPLDDPDGDNRRSLTETLEVFERRLISEALRRNGMSLSRAAEDLKMAKTTLHDRIRKYKLSVR